ncbi:hypothetical protein H8E52_11365 [bacterium]|nr:hypothetical protein [bacterium]
MVYGKELNKRSPLRVFERSIHGGLGKGNIGVVTSRKGVGKTAMLIGVALDDLLQERKVLHVTVGGSVENLSRFYEEIFRDLAASSKIEDLAETRLTMVSNRHLLAYRDGDFSVERIRKSMGFLSEHAAFEPYALILDGWPDFATVSPENLAELKKLAEDMQVEIWITALRHRVGQERDERDVPVEVARHDEHLSVIVRLEPMADHVKLRIVKDHENKDLADLHLELDPKTLLLKWG